MLLSSPAFEHESPIPTRYTIDGDDVSPPLSWAGVPAGTRSLALIVDDPSAPAPVSSQVGWGHWIVYNLSPHADALPDAASGKLAGQAAEGTNDWGGVGYGGPSPPHGVQRYVFRLYALNTELTGLTHPTKIELEQAMDGHILAVALLAGTYRRPAAQEVRSQRAIAR